MADGDSYELPRFGEAYDLERWSDGTTDSSGDLVWHNYYPEDSDWQNVTHVTLNFDPNGEGDYRNYNIDPDKPLDVWDSYDPDSPDPYYYDLDDLAGEAYDYYGFSY